MLKTDDIDELNVAVDSLTCDVTEYLIDKIVRAWTTAAKMGELGDKTTYYIWRVREMGVTLPELEAEVRRRLEAKGKEAGDLAELYLAKSWTSDAERLLTAGVDGGKIERVGGDIRRIAQAAMSMTEGKMKDYTKTLGMIDRNGLWQPMRTAYLDGCDWTFRQTITGAETYTKAVQDTARNLWKDGIRVVDYESGVTTTLDVAVRRALLSTLGTAQAEINKVMGDELGLDGVEITAHAASAPDHEPIQGRQFRKEDYELLNSSLKRQIGTLNCGHVAFPVLYGTPTQYTPEELEEMRKKNETGVTIDGKEYTQYEATQQMRKLERAMRKQYRKGLTLQSAGDADGLSACTGKLEAMAHEYNRFAEQAGLTPQTERVWVPEGKLKIDLRNA